MKPRNAGELHPPQRGSSSSSEVRVTPRPQPRQVFGFPPPAPTDDSLNPEQGRTHAKLSAEAGPRGNEGAPARTTPWCM